MDDSTFDELFSDKLHEEQEFDFREEDWTELSDRLENKPKRKWGWLFFAAGLLMAVSFAANIWQAWNLQKIQGEISTLQEEVLKQNQTIKSLHLEHQMQLSEQVIKSNQLLEERDTIYKTIYKTIIQEKEVPVYIYPENNQSSKGGNLPNSKISVSPLKEATNPLISNPDNKINSELVPQNHLSQLASAPLLPLDVLNRSLVLSAPELEEETADKIVKPAFKKTWRLGPSVAYSRVPNNCVSQRNQHFGLDLNVDLSKRWTLESSYSYNRISNICPVVQPLDSNAFFLPATNQRISQDEVSYALSRVRNIRSDQRYFQIAMGAKYHLSKRFYVGAHVLAYSLFKREVSINAPGDYANYELAAPGFADKELVLESFNLVGNDFFSQNDDLLSPSSPGGGEGSPKPGLILDRMEITAGTTFNIKNKYEVPLELFYQRNLNVAQFSLPSLVGVRASFLFKL